ncbi:MAG: endonuclease/exonuclease/phosphatase family protein, partial [Acidobacteriaceae bacterium]|nr:endonuclease/exonuclease/phosphatase family protein [Acidobacteriaceae bacterium]
QVAPPVHGLSSLRVVTWNIDRGERLGVVAAELQRNAADLLLLQEVDWNTARAGQVDVAAELAHSLHLNAAYAIEFEELGQERGDKAFIGQATLTRLPLRRSRVLRFRRQSGWWKPHAWIPSSVPLLQRRLGSRIALVTELEFAGGLLVVYNAHLESRSSGPIQSAQIEEILQDVKQYPPKTLVIIGGDLNTKYFPSVYLHRLERAGFRSATGERIERTHAIAMALDWMFVKGPARFTAGDVRREFKGSDHYPLYARLEMKR